MARRKARIVNKRLTRGPRKGKTIKVYASSGTEVRTKRSGSTGVARGRGGLTPRARGAGGQALTRGQIGRRKRRATTAKKYVRTATRGLNQSNHAKAGLHRIGKTGNRYADASGKLYKRNAKGGFSRGVGAKKPSKKAVATRKARKSTQRSTAGLKSRNARAQVRQDALVARKNARPKTRTKKRGPSRKSKRR